MDTFSALLAICDGSLDLMQSFDAFFAVEQSSFRLFDTPWFSRVLYTSTWDPFY